MPRSKQHTSAPESQTALKFVNELLGKFSEPGDFIYRGTNESYSQADDGVSSSLYREYAKSAISPNPYNDNFYPIHIEKEIVDKAKKHFPDNASNIEVLTELQHYHGKQR